jgi:hypothetical protein
MKPVQVRYTDSDSLGDAQYFIPSVTIGTPKEI